MYIFAYPQLRSDIMISYRDLRKGARLFYIKQLNLIQFHTSVWPVAYQVRRKIAKSACYLQRVALLSVRRSVRISTCIGLGRAGRIYVNFGIGDFYENPSRNPKLGQNWSKTLKDFLPPSSEQKEKAPCFSEILIEFLSVCFTSHARRH